MRVMTVDVHRRMMRVAGHGMHDRRRNRPHRRLKPHQETGADQDRRRQEQVFDACLGAFHEVHATQAGRADGRRDVPDQSRSGGGAGD
jgi:hypothetical protein